MENKLIAPNNIPLVYFYFGWKKARKFQMKEYGFYDPIEINEFELELESNLRELKNEFDCLKYDISPIKVYLYPKAPSEGEIKFRPMGKVHFRDQVAWATVLLVLGEWFDSNHQILEQSVFEDPKQAQIYNWMYDWSCNNRLRRRYYPNENENEFKRLMINYTSSDLYESFQWGLRRQREFHHKWFEEVRKYTNGDAFYGKADIAKFYPSLDIKFVKESLDHRLDQLRDNEVITKIDAENWKGILGELLNFQYDTDDLTEKQLCDIGFKKEFLSLPIGLIASGFLSNCVLTDTLDREMDQFCKQQKSPTFITRYTDDITIIASNSKVVISGLTKIKNVLKRIGLDLSKEKMIPQLEMDIKDHLKSCFEELSDSQIEKIVRKVYAKQLECPKIGKRDNIPGSTSIIDKLSQLGDQQVKAMDSDELMEYINEVSDLIETDFAPEEIREDTKTTFAAWRILKGSKELQNRNLQGSGKRLLGVLKKSFMKYPYKLSLVDCYVLMLLQLPLDISEEEIINLFELTRKTDSMQIPGAYGDFVRTRILFTIAESWSSVNESSREKMKKIILNGLKKWYKQSPSWHEQMAICWLLVSANITNDPKLFSQKEDTTEYRMYKLFKLMKRDSTNGNDPSLVYTLSKVWRNSRFYGNRNEELPKPEVQWISWFWKEVAKEDNWKWSEDGHGRLWASMATRREFLIPVFGYKKLIKVAETNWWTNDYDSLVKKFQECEVDAFSIFSGVSEIVDKVIAKWIIDHNSNESKTLFKAIGELSETSIFRKYVLRRIKNLVTIERWLCEENSGLATLPKFLIEDSSENKEIALKDYVDFIEAHRGRKMPLKMALLTESEIAELIVSIIGKLPESVMRQSDQFWYFKYPEIFSINLDGIMFTMEEWSNWREQGQLNFKLADGIQEVVPIEWYFSGWIYLSNEIVSVDQQLCYSLSKLMLRLIAKKSFFANALGVARLRGWRGIADTISMAGYPSTEIASLIAGSLNYQKIYYNIFSEKWGINLPSLDLESKPAETIAEFRERLIRHTTRLKERYFISNTGVQEIIYIDVDMLVKGE